jgi:hypothetical protein
MPTDLDALLQQSGASAPVVPPAQPDQSDKLLQLAQTLSAALAPQGPQPQGGMTPAISTNEPRPASPDQFPTQHPVVTAILQGLASGKQVAGEPAPNLSQGSAHPVLSRILQALGGVASAAGQVGRQTSVPEQRRGQTLSALESSARLKETSTWREQMGNVAQQRADIAGERERAYADIGEQRNAISRQQMSDRLTQSLAGRGYVPIWDQTTHEFQGIRPMTKDELSLQGQANLGRTNAQTADIADRGQRARQIAQGHDDVRLEIARIGSTDREARTALSSLKPEMEAAHTEFVLGMHDLTEQRREADHNGYVDFQNSKSSFDNYYNGQVSKLTGDLKDAATKAGIFTAPGGGGGTQRVRVKNLATGQSGTILSKDFDSIKYQRLP